jgi:hypothetical protein
VHLALPWRARRRIDPVVATQFDAIAKRSIDSTLALLRLLSAYYEPR